MLSVESSAHEWAPAILQPDFHTRIALAVQRARHLHFQEWHRSAFPQPLPPRKKVEGVNSRSRQNSATLCPLRSCSRISLRHFVHVRFVGCVMPQHCYATQSFARCGSFSAHSLLLYLSASPSAFPVNGTRRCGSVRLFRQGAGSTIAPRT